MSVTNQIKEELSYAYVHAVASRAGFFVENVRKDLDSIDITISARGKVADDSVLLSPKLDIQLKASAVLEPSDGIIPFKLPIKNYNDLRGTTMAPRILVVLQLHKEENLWLSGDCNELKLRKCAYWLSLKGAPEIENETNKTVYIPEANFFGLDSLKVLMTKASKGEVLGTYNDQ